MMLNGRKFRNFLIFPRFQLTLVAVNLAVLAINFSIIFYQVSDSFKQIFTLANDLRIPKYSSFYSIIDYHHNLIWNQLLLACVIIFALTFIITIIISHRASGPIHNLKNYFTRIAQTGEVPKLQFRSKDYYEDLPEIINNALDKIKETNQNKQD